MHLVALFIFLFSAQASAAKTRYHFEDPLKRDHVHFILSAPLEDIRGQSSDISGWLELDPHNLTTARGEFLLPVSSLKTGIGLRDQHMHDTYLEIKRFPEIKFKIKSMRSADTKKTSTPETAPTPKNEHKSLSSRQTLAVVLVGDLEFHGATKTLELPATLSLFTESKMTQSKLRGDLLHLNVDFSITLKDFFINRPQAVALQVGETASISVSLTGSNIKPEKPKSEKDP